MRLQQEKLTNEYQIAEKEDPHVGMAEARRGEEYKLKGFSQEKERLTGAIYLVELGSRQQALFSFKTTSVQLTCYAGSRLWRFHTMWS